MQMDVGLNKNKRQIRTYVQVGLYVDHTVMSISTISSTSYFYVESGGHGWAGQRQVANLSQG